MIATIILHMILNQSIPLKLGLIFIVNQRNPLQSRTALLKQITRSNQYVLTMKNMRIMSTQKLNSIVPWNGFIYVKTVLMSTVNILITLIQSRIIWQISSISGDHSWTMLKQSRSCKSKIT